MNPRLLTIFITVCDTLNMTEAARQLFMTQPAVSAAIKALEEDLGVVLFERLNRRLHLTPSGILLRDYARHLVRLSDEAQSAVNALHQATPLRLGSSITIGIKLLPKLVADFKTKHPEISVSVTVDNTDTILAMVADDRLDLGMVEGLAPSLPLVANPFQHDELVVMAHPNSPLVDHSVVSLPALLEHPLLLRDTQSGTRKLVDAALLQHGTCVTPRWESSSTLALVEAVKADLGVAILPKRLVEDALTKGDVVLINVPDLNLSREFIWVIHQDKYRSPSLRAWIDLLHENTLHEEGVFI